MLDLIPYQMMHKYPHMAPADTYIWERFIQAYPTYFKAVAYDVPVGAGAEFDTVVAPSTGGDVKKLYQRRVDVIGLRGDDTCIVELKPRASTAAIGQIRAYMRLVERDMPELKNLHPLIITDSLVPEMDFLAAADNVELIVV